jgi:hypothetical protein
VGAGCAQVERAQAPLGFGVVLGTPGDLRGLDLRLDAAQPIQDAESAAELVLQAVRARNEQAERTTVGVALEVALGALEQHGAGHPVAQRDRDRDGIIGVERPGLAGRV